MELTKEQILETVGTIDFRTLNKKQLRKVLKLWGIESTGRETKEEMLSILRGAGWDYEEAYRQSGSIKVEKKNWLLVLTIILSLLILITGIATGIILGIDKVYMSWGNREVTFYSQKPFSNYGDENFFSDPSIDGGFNDSVYKGSYEYSKYKNDTLKQKSTIGITQSITWDNDADSYINDLWGLDAGYKSGAKKIVSSGFNISEAYNILYGKDGFSDEDFARNGWSSIIIDDNQNGVNHESATSVTFDSADAGFLAGIAASVYTTYQLDQNYDEWDIDPAYVKYVDDIVTWGGWPLPTVYDWLSGFEQGVNYFNYAIFGIDVIGNEHRPDETTLGISTYPWYPKNFLADGLDLTNGYDVTPDYSTSFSMDNENLSLINSLDTQEKSWYTTSFDGEVSTNGGKFARDRANKAVNRNISTVFPVAGGQTITAIEEVTRFDDGTLPTRVIGVDVDGTKTSDNEDVSEHYLGSATKSLQTATSLSLWATDEEAQSKGNDYTPTFNGVSGSDFISVNSEENEQGWRIEEYNGQEVKGNLFEGTYQNGGVGFTKGLLNSDGITELDEAYTTIREDYFSKTHSLDNGNFKTFDSFLEHAYEVNSIIGIENSSATFSPSGTKQLTAPSAALWIPDWTVYFNTY